MSSPSASEVMVHPTPPDTLRRASTDFEVMARWFPLRVVAITPPPDAAEHAAYVVYVRDKALGMMVLLGAVVLCAVVLWWPLDPLLFGDDPAALAAMTKVRLGGLVAAALLLVGKKVAWIRRAPHVFLLALIMVFNGVNGALMGQAGGLDGPWLYFFLVTPTATVLVPMTIRLRVAGTLATAGAPIVSFAATNPEALNSPHLPVVASFMLFVAAGAILFGVALEQLLESQFVHQRRWLRLRDGLQRGIAERAAEVSALAERCDTLQVSAGQALARDLHDDLGQQLGAVRFEVARAMRDAERRGGSVDELVRIQEQLERAGGAMRRTLLALRPEALARLSAREAVRWLVSDCERRLGVSATLTIAPEDLEIPAPLTLPLFRSVQEGLVNVARHAGAARAQVVVAAEDQELRLSIDDDGTAEAVEGATEGSGLGLLGIRERAAALGGRARWGRNERGFELRVAFPLEAA